MRSFKQDGLQQGMQLHFQHVKTIDQGKTSYCLLIEKQGISGYLLEVKEEDPHKKEKKNNGREGRRRERNQSERSSALLEERRSFENSELKS